MTPTTSSPAEAQRSRLSKATVVRRALALADAGGLDALTIRRLAQELGVTPMALYWHFRSKEELLAGLGDQIWTEVSTGTDPDAPWHEQLREIMESLVAVLRAHPSASELLITGEKNNSPAAMQVTEVALGSAAPRRFRRQVRQLGGPQRAVDRTDAGHERARAVGGDGGDE